MNQRELKNLVARVSLRELEDEDEADNAFEEDERFWVLNLPNPPSTPSEIESCEFAVGRMLPSTYKDFLLLHDGWKDIQGDITLLGFSDYKSIDTQRELGELIWAQLRGLGAPLINVSTDELMPPSFYPILDGKADCPPNMIPLVKFIYEFKETDTISLQAKSTIFGLANGGVLCFRGDEVLENYAQGGVLKRHPDFWSWLNYYSQWRVWRSDE